MSNQTKLDPKVFIKAAKYIEKYNREIGCCNALYNVLDHSIIKLNPYRDFLFKHLAPKRAVKFGYWYGDRSEQKNQDLRITALCMAAELVKDQNAKVR